MSMTVGFVLLLVGQIVLPLLAQPSHCNNSQCYTVTVSDDSDADNSRDCHIGQYPCRTLQYAIQNGSLCDCTEVSVNYSTGVVHLNESIWISHKSNISIAGIGVQVVYCDFGAGIGFENVESIRIENLGWNGCSIVHPTTALEPSRSVYFPNVSSALYFYHSMDIDVANCSFTSQRGSGITMYDVGGLVMIKNSDFVNNSLEYDCTNDQCYNRSVGIQIEKTYCGNFLECLAPIDPTNYTSYSTYIIENCVFHANNNTLSPKLSRTEAILSYREHRTLAHGGGLAIRLTGTAQFNSFEVRGCVFSENHALWGAGMEVGVGDECVSNAIRVIDCDFTANVGLTGGALRLGLFPSLDYSGYGANQPNNSFLITNSNFSRNFAQSAGALSFFSNRQVTTDDISRLEIENSYFTDNSANISGAAVGISAWSGDVAGYPPLAVFTSCTFYENAIRIRIDHPGVYGLGVVSAEGIPVEFRGSTNFSANSGSALVASLAIVNITGRAVFEGNYGINGGAIHLMGLARIALIQPLDLTFKENGAFLSGGAIYSSYAIPRAVNETRYCIMELHNLSSNESEWNISISFVDNAAQTAGDSIYLSTPGGCYRNDSINLPFTDDRIYRYSPSIQIATPPSEIEFEYPAQFNETDGSFTTEVMLGQPFQIQPLTEDVFDQFSLGTAMLELICVQSFHCPNGTSIYQLEGQTLIQLSNTSTTTSFSVTGPQAGNQQREDTVLFLLTNTFPSAVGYLHLNITPCRLGYVYSDTTQKCECYNSENIHCDGNTVCIKYGYWYGSIARGSSDYTIHNCPTGNCNYDNGKCPTESCDDPYQTFCKLPKYDSDELCSSNRGGAICAECRPGYKFSYSALQCVPESGCSVGTTVGLMFLSLAFWILLIVVILIVLKLNLRIGSGQLYSLIYYFGVLQYFTSNAYPSTFLQVVIYTFSSFTQLKPLLLGLMRVCFSADVNALGHQMLFFLNPTFISLVMLAIVGITHYWPRFSTISKQNYLVKAICILLYLSFTSLSETSLTILNFVRFENIPGKYVFIQPTVPYFNLRRHLPFALVALSVQLLIIIPFLFLMLFSPCLARMRRVNLTRIKPILDEYQSCYKDEYRWFAGYYLAARQFVFLFSLFELGEFGSIFFLQILSIGILMIHAAFQPYRKQWLNVLDIIILGDLAMYSLMNGSTANVVLGSKAVRDAAIHILILIPVLYFFGLCISNITYRLYKRKKFELTESTVTFAPSEASNKYPYPKTDSTASKPPVFVPMEREPLIFIESEPSSADPDSVSSEGIRAACLKSDYQAATAATPFSSEEPGGSRWYNRLAYKIRPAKTTSATFNPKMSSHELTDSFATDVYAKQKYTTSVVSAPVGRES